MAVEKLKALYESLKSDQLAWGDAFRARDNFLDEQENAVAYASAYAHAKATDKTNAHAYAEAYCESLKSIPDFESESGELVTYQFENGGCVGWSENHAALPEFDHQTYIDSDAFREAYLGKFPEANANSEIEKVKALLEGCYSSDVPRYSKALLELAEIFKPATLADVRSKKAEIQACLDMHRVAATNLHGEFGDGQTIQAEIASAFTKAISVDVFDEEDIENFDFSSGCMGRAQELVQNYIFYKLGNFQYLFYCYPELVNRYYQEIEQVLFEYYSRMEVSLSADSKRPVLPDFLATPKVVKVPNSDVIKAPSIIFSELFKEFLEYKVRVAGLSDKMQRDYKDYVKIFLFAVGDLPVAEITKKIIKDFLNQYGQLPRRTLKAYKGKQISELWGCVVPEGDRIAVRTMTGTKKFLLGIFRYAVNQEYLISSPAADLDMKIKLEKKRGHFLDSEVRKIFEVLESDTHYIKNKWMKWAVLFGAYTGARAGEVLNLLKEDIKRDAELDCWSVVVRGTKTRNALREFPVPPELIDKGFLEFVGNGSGKVFAESKSDKSITNFFPLILEKSGVPKVNTKNLSRSFHSFRHSVVTKVRGAGFSESLIQQIVGHERTGAGITDTYTHDFTPEQLLPVVQVITY
uniref:DUF3258 domain-containing protein n=1 Tax=Cellvibrio fontiphilus TaxID=1815559 RepID=UPI002B4BBF70|nr:DUF3258 domain-containing protein [Cellvibrio fontiphilus]